MADELDEAGVEAAAAEIAAHNVCETLGNCNPAACACRKDARAAITAYLGAQTPEEPDD